MKAPFLKDKWGMDRDRPVLVVPPGKQSQEHLFNECKRWKTEIHRMWEKVGSVSGKRNPGEQKGEQ